MIFISTGTQLPFDRFIKAMDSIANDLNEEIVVQAIQGDYTPNNFKLRNNIPMDQFNKLIEDARVIVAHAGMGTIITAMLKSKPIIVFPRDASLGEHRNDHQNATCKHFEEMGIVNVAWDEHQLKTLIMDKDLKSLKSIGDSASTQLLDSITSFIDSKSK